MCKHCAIKRLQSKKITGKHFCYQIKYFVLVCLTQKLMQTKEKNKSNILCMFFNSQDLLPCKKNLGTEKITFRKSSWCSQKEFWTETNSSCCSCFFCWEFWFQQNFKSFLNWNIIVITYAQIYLLACCVYPR